MSQVENLFCDYGDFRLHIPWWEIADQGVTALWGPSGAGKTSVFRILVGLDACPTLRWIFKGENLAQLPVPQRRLGVVFQSLELFPHLTAAENIKFAARARHRPKDEVQEDLAILSRQLQLDKILDRPARVLSGGESQRVALARALIGQPRFLFLDEPFSSLDQNLRAETRNLVKEVIEKRKIPTLLVTHDQEDLKILAQYVVGIHHGELQGEQQVG